MMLAMVASLALAAPSPLREDLAAGESTIESLIGQLTADQIGDRDAAAAQLGFYGNRARAALLGATRPDQPPERRARATALLCALSWARPDDPPPARDILVEYRTIDAGRRMQVAERLGSLGGDGFDVLRRLLIEEPVEDVRWAIVSQLRRYGMEEQRKKLREWDTAEDPLLLASAAWAWQVADPDKGVALLREVVNRVIDHPIDLARPSSTPPPKGQEPEVVAPHELIVILRALHFAALNQGDHEEAMLRIRQMLLHEDRSASDCILEIMVAHADHGPCHGFEEDLRMARQYIATPEMLYVMGRLSERQNNRLGATVYYQMASAAGLSTQENHRRVAKFLLDHRWYDLAAIEAKAAMSLKGPRKIWGDGNAMFYLSRCAAARGDDAEAAAMMTASLQTIRMAGFHFYRAADLQAEVDWHLLRVAMDSGDRDEITKYAERLSAYKPDEPENPQQSDRLIDLVLAFKHLGREDEAKAIFQMKFDDYKRQLEFEPHGVSVLNNIAWFCARCREHGAEAVEWSSEAVRRAPATGAYRDTAAEALANVGRFEDAATAEQTAIKLQPREWFMMKQLTRFQQAVKAKP
jgi:tetratricopeptide (TPR) repeat protein